MPLWRARDLANGAPKFAAFGGLGVAANGQILFDNVAVGIFKTGASLSVQGVQAANTGTGNTHDNVTHAGWVAQTLGTGYILRVQVTNGGTGYTPGSGSITFSTAGSSGVGAVATFQANAGGSIANVTLSNSGNTYNVAVTANAAVTYTTPAAFLVTMGGRVGRKSFVTLVATGSIV